MQSEEVLSYHGHGPTVSPYSASCLLLHLYSVQYTLYQIPVSRILHHIHPCLIYESIMRHIRDKYDAIMKQISIIFSKNEVVGAAILVYCQTTIIIKL